MFENEGFRSWFKETFQKEDCLNNVVFTRKFLLDAWNNGYNKANEWHYVKDGKYPTDEKDVQVMYQDCDKINVYNCIYDTHAENWLYYNLDDMILELFPFTVIAWKEIVLPKESD